MWSAVAVPNWRAELRERMAAHAGARAIERQLFGVPAADIATFVWVPLVVVAAGACWVPAQRAARVDPAIALSAE